MSAFLYCSSVLVEVGRRSPATAPNGSPQPLSSCTPTPTAPTPNGSSTPAGHRRPPRLCQPPAVGAHARLRRPLPHQSPPLLRHLHRAARGPDQLPPQPGPRTRTSPIRTADHADDKKPPSSSATLSYAGTGWNTTGDALLANTAADQARKRREAGHDQLASEYSEVFSVTFS